MDRIMFAAGGRRLTRGLETSITLVLLVTALAVCGLVAPVSAHAAGRWSTVQPPASESDEWFGPVRFFDAKCGVIQQAYPSGAFYLTTDGGASWITRRVQSLNYGIGSAFFLDMNHWWADDNLGLPIEENDDYIIRSADSGLNWDRTGLSLPYSGVQLFFVDTKNGYAVGSSYRGFGGSVLKTTDGGVSWREVSDQGGVDLFFVTALEGWIIDFHVSSGGESAIHSCAIYHTLDGGASWDVQYEGSGVGFTSRRALLDVYFVDRLHGWVLGWLGNLGYDGTPFVLRTTDGGQSWQESAVPTDKELNDSCFVSADVGWVVGEAGTILRTNDGGRTWTQEDSGTSADLRSVSFSDADHGWVVGGWHPLLLRYTTDPSPFAPVDAG